MSRIACQMFLLVSLCTTVVHIDSTCNRNDWSIDVLFLLERSNYTKEYIQKAAELNGTHTFRHAMSFILQDYPNTRFAVASTSSQSCYHLDHPLSAAADIDGWAAIGDDGLELYGLAVQGSIIALQSQDVKWNLDKSSPSFRVIVAIVEGPPAVIDPLKPSFINSCNQSPPSPGHAGELLRKELNAGLILLVARLWLLQEWEAFAKRMQGLVVVRALPILRQDLPYIIHSTVSEIICNAKESTAPSQIRSLTASKTSTKPQKKIQKTPKKTSQTPLTAPPKQADINITKIPASTAAPKQKDINITKIAASTAAPKQKEINITKIAPVETSEIPSPETAQQKILKMLKNMLPLFIAAGAAAVIPVIGVACYLCCRKPLRSLTTLGSSTWGFEPAGTVPYRRHTTAQGGKVILEAKPSLKYINLDEEIVSAEEMISEAKPSLEYINPDEEVVSAEEMISEDGDEEIVVVDEAKSENDHSDEEKSKEWA